jgi:hypothetical protein
MNGLLHVIDMLGHTIMQLQARVAELERENAELKAVKD